MVRRCRAALVAVALLTVGACWTGASPRVGEHAQAAPAAGLPTGTIRGVTRGRDGSPLPARTVYLRWPSGETRATTTNERGEYVFGGLPPGEYEIAVRTGRARRELQVRLTQEVGERRDLTLDVPIVEPRCCKP